MIQTPILDNALQSTKDAVKTSAPIPKKASGSASVLKDRLDSQRGTNALSIVDLFIGDEGAYEIAKFLKQNKEFSSIQLRGNNISAAGFESICQALRGFSNLKDITAEWNNIGSDVSGLVALHQVLRSNTTIETVDLKNNRLGPSCGRIIGDIIRDANSLKKIDLRWNELGDEGGNAILDAFQESNKRITLDLSGNKIHEDILAQIDAYSLKKTPLGVRASTDFNRTGFSTQSTAQKGGVTSTQERRARFSNSTLPNKYGNVANLESAPFNPNTTQTIMAPIRHATPPRGDVFLQRTSAIEPVHLTHMPPPPTYVVHPPQQIVFVDQHEHNVDDVARHIEVSRHNIARYSPERLNRLTHEEIAQRRGETRVSTQPGPDLASTQKYRRVQMTPSMTDIGHESSGVNALRRSVGVAHHAAVETNVRRENDDGNLKVGKLISDLERMVEKEQLRAIEAETKFNTLATDFETEQMMRLDLEKKHSYILDELRKRDLEVNELRVALEELERENNGLKSDVNRLSMENERLDQFNKEGLNLMETKYTEQLKRAHEQNHELRVQLDSVQHELNTQILDLRRELDGRCRNYEEQILDITKLNDELSNELASQLDYIERLKVDHAENIKRTIVQVRDEEFQKAQIIITDLEGKIQALTAANEQLGAKNAEMLADLQNYEKQIRDQHIQFANELARLGAEIDKLRGDLNQANVIIQKQNADLQARDALIRQLEGDIDIQRAEIQRLVDSHAQGIRNLENDFNIERRRFADAQRQLAMTIEDLEKRLIESQNETVTITREYDRLVEIIKGNVTKAIQDTFVTHKNTSEIRHIEHRTTATRPFFK